ncbi:MAG: hypothetical protein HYY40_05470 [Bacteroidetes bacterium]|nr:hypothetical protein [Bacteroidota bacterium]
MDTLILITDFDLLLEDVVKWIDKSFDIKQETGYVYFGNQTGRYVSIGHDNNIINEFEENERNLFKSLIKEPSFFCIDGNDFNYLKKVVSMFPDNLKILFHNDHNGILSKQEFLNCKNYESFININNIKQAGSPVK